MEMEVGKLKEILQNAIDELENYDDKDKVVLQCNTYGIGHPFIGLYDGFVDLTDLRVREDEEEEESSDEDDEN